MTRPPSTTAGLAVVLIALCLLAPAHADRAAPAANLGEHDRTFDKGVSHYSAGRSDQALPFFLRAAELATDHQAHFAAGMCLQDLSRFEEAEAQFLKAASIHEIEPDYWLRAANSNLAMERYERARPLYEKALDKAGGSATAEMYNNAGTAYMKLGQHAKAKGYFVKAMKVAPNEQPIYFNIAVCDQWLQEYEEGVMMMKKAIELRPDNYQSYVIIGQTYFKMGMTKESIEWLVRGVRLDPSQPEAYLHLGNTIQRMDSWDVKINAMDFYFNALRLHPTSDDTMTQIWNNIGCVYSELENHEHAAFSFSQSLLIDPVPLTMTSTTEWHADMNSAPFFNRARIRQQICDWEGQETEHRVMALITDAELQAGKAATLHPFYALPYRLPYSLLHRISVSFCTSLLASVQRHVQPLNHPNSLTQSRRLRIGYVSSNFRNHPEADMTQRLYQLHDSSVYEAMAFSLRARPAREDTWGTWFYEKIQSEVAHFADLTDLVHQDAAAEINRLGVHILVSLNGYLRDSRTEIFLLRPAPVQILPAVGYPSSQGCSAMDYYVSDSIISPPAYSEIYVEKLVYLPHSYQINNYAQTYTFVHGDAGGQIKAKNYLRSDVGIPEDSVVFHNSCQLYKVEPKLFESWIRIIRAVPKSVLWLLAFPKEGGPNIIKAWRRAGMDMDRLIVSEKVSRNEHAKRVKIADVFLDTWQVNAHSTASDVLWAGVPFVTLAAQETVASRVGASLISSLGLPELIASSEEDYERIAIDLGRHPERLRMVRSKLEGNRSTHPLFDTELWVRDFERVLRMAWEVRQENPMAAHLSTPPQFTLR